MLALDCYVGNLTNGMGAARRETCSPIELNRRSTTITTSNTASNAITIRNGACTYDTDCTMQKLCRSNSAYCKVL